MDKIRIVLVGTTHPGNIGAAARAMKTMGLATLYLVAPKVFPSAEATARAAGADDLLAHANVVTNLPEAVADCRLVVATTARNRAVPWPVATPREFAEQAQAAAERSPVAVVFGREHSGLDNTEIEQANLVVSIPTADGFGSLNVAAAVQLLCYELRLAWLEDKPSSDNDYEPLATADELGRLYRHWQLVMETTGFTTAERGETLMRRVKRLFTKASLEHREVQILRGFLTSIEDALGRERR